MGLFTLLGVFSLILIVGGLISAGLLAWHNDRARGDHGHGGHPTH
jgi:hypothetical protein